MSFTLKIGGVYKTYSGDYEIKFETTNGVRLIKIWSGDELSEELSPSVDEQVVITYHAEQ